MFQIDIIYYNLKIQSRNRTVYFIFFFLLVKEFIICKNVEILRQIFVQFLFKTSYGTHFTGKSRNVFSTCSENVQDMFGPSKFIHSVFLDTSQWTT